MRRIYYEGNVYHVIARGNNRNEILASDHDKRVFLQIIDRYRNKFQFKFHGFVLMDNHFHMVIATNKKHNVSRIMQSILLSYSIYYRRKYNYVGHVWQGRFISKVIISHSYLIECLMYIHNNPVRADMIKKAEDYEWSSYFYYQDNIKKKSKTEISIDIPVLT